MISLSLKALGFAINAHGEIDQRRKYTNEPYIVHPFTVGMIVRDVGGNEEQIAAAFLHDVAEDTNHTLDEIYDEFGATVAEYVYWLTEVSSPEDGDRAARKAIDLAHIAKAPPEAKTIKLADLIHNTQSIVQHDPNFAEIYMKEKQKLLEVLKEGDGILYARCQAIISDYYASTGSA